MRVLLGSGQEFSSLIVTADFTNFAVETSRWLDVHVLLFMDGHDDRARSKEKLYLLTLLCLGFKEEIRDKPPGVVKRGFI